MFYTLVHIITIFLLIKYYLKLHNARAKSYKSLVGKTTIITGANTGKTKFNYALH